MYSSYYKKRFEIRGPSLLGCITVHYRYLCVQYVPGMGSHKTVQGGRNTEGIWALEVILSLCLHVVPGSVQDAKGQSGRQAGCSGSLPPLLFTLCAHTTAQTVTHSPNHITKQRPTGPTGTKSLILMGKTVTGTDFAASESLAP